MPLTWDMTRVENFTELDDDWELLVTKAIALRMNECGLRAIIASEAAEAFARIRVTEQHFGATLVHRTHDYLISPTDVKRRIGMRSNAKMMTDAAFRKAIINELMTRAATDYVRNTR